LVVLLLLLAAPFAVGQQPRFANGVLLSFDTVELRLLVKPMDGSGAPRAFSFGKAPAPFEALMLRDYYPRRDGRLAVSAAGVLPGQDGIANLILHFNLADPAQPATLANTGAVICVHLAEAEGRLWCLGSDLPALMRGQDFGVLYQFDEATLEPRAVVKRGALPREATQSPWAPGSQLVAAANGELLAWMPGVRRMVRIAGERIRIDELPWEPRPQSPVSVALDEQGRLHALLPLDSEETLVTPYALFRRDGREWMRLSRDAVPRGVRLLAVEGGAALLIDRRERLLRVPLAAVN
jgi:hypothetical protein